MNSIKIKYFVILTFFIIISCDDKKEVNVIEKGKMAKILLELHLSEESIDMLKFKNIRKLSKIYGKLKFQSFYSKGYWTC